jgi:transcriptional regulator with XRE-family HTH domain
MRTESRFGKKVRELRIDRGWSQEQLAEIAGIATRTVQRVEKDQTRDGETLQAIAAAFDVTVKELRTDFWVAESQPPKALMIESAEDFRVAIQRAYHFYTRRILVEPRPESEARIRKLVDLVFADIWAMEPDEPELTTSYIDSIREPLVELKAMGMTFFSVQERRDVFIKGEKPGERLPMEDVTYGHFFLAPVDGCFREGGDGQSHPLHRFSARCEDAVRTLLRITQKELDMSVAVNPMYVMTAEGSDAASIQWCDECFPEGEDGCRISWDDLERFTGLTSEQMTNIVEEARELAVGTNLDSEISQS